MKNLKLLVPKISQIVCPTRMQCVARVNAVLLNVPRVQLVPGKNQYLLLTIHIHGQTRYGRTIIRGDADKSHVEIFYDTKKQMDKFEICTKAIGGGFIDNTEKKKIIKIYGCCKTYGEAPHGKTKDILLSWTKYQDFNIFVPNTRFK
ncbi:hypothetical protein KR032_001744 [Drosophila birchii]|nr:hypothetical protein KR032_001744 [Drosophila birchii]